MQLKLDRGRDEGLNLAPPPTGRADFPHSAFRSLVRRNGLTRALQTLDCPSQATQLALRSRGRGPFESNPVSGSFSAPARTAFFGHYADFGLAWIWRGLYRFRCFR
jgi:hypothetical protein